jgi:hypothetical protein
MCNYAVCSFTRFLSLVERTQTLYCQKGNVVKGAIFEKLRFSIIILRMKKLLVFFIE